MPPTTTPHHTTHTTHREKQPKKKNGPNHHRQRLGPACRYLHSSSKLGTVSSEEADYAIDI
jgi:hypothetical protein